MWKWIRRRALTAQSVTPAAAERLTIKLPGKTSKVSGNSAGLHNYLANRYADMVVLTFSQLEDLLGSALPDSARTQQEWWTSTDRDKSSCADAWILAGRTARPNLLARTVAFERRAEPLRDTQAAE